MSAEIRANAKRIKCSNKDCNKTFAYLIDGKTIDIARQGHKVTIVGKDFAMIATCGWCKEKTSLVVTDGVLDEHGLVFKPDIKEDDGTNQPQDPEKHNPKDPDDSGASGSTGEPTPEPGSTEPPTGSEAGEPGATGSAGEPADPGTGEPGEPEPDTGKPKRKYTAKP